MWGRHHSEQSKDKMRKPHKQLSITTRQKMSASRRGKSTWNAGKIGVFSEETKRKLSAAGKANWLNPEFRKRCLRGLPGRDNPNYQGRQMHKILSRLKARPTSLEKKFAALCQKYTLPYKYTGDGSVLIGYKNPDFVNINGQKICIEVANRYHHPDPYKENRIKHFAKWGWKCIVFFEDELDESEMLEVLK